MPKKKSDTTDRLFKKKLDIKILLCKKIIIKVREIIGATLIVVDKFQ